MANCVSCTSQIVPSKCVKSEQELSFEYNSLDDILIHLDEGAKETLDILKKRIDKKWIKEEKEYVIDYIQDLINELDVIKKSLSDKKSDNIVLSGKQYTQLSFNTEILNRIKLLEESLNSNVSSLYRI